MPDIYYLSVSISYLNTKSFYTNDSKVLRSIEGLEMQILRAIQHILKRKGLCKIKSIKTKVFKGKQCYCK